MVAFEEHFWGDKNSGYDVLYHNMKYGSNASKELADFIRDRASVEESYVKSLQKLARSATSVSQLGSFDPLWGVLRVSTDKLASAHLQVIQKLHELMKEIKDYGEKQKEKHKTAKEEFSSTAEIVQTIQTMTSTLQKVKENYYARCQDMERCRKDGSNTKDIEKAELKMKKAGEEYKVVVERREIIRNDFHDRMASSSKKFQKIEEEHLKNIVGYLESYIEAHRAGQSLIKQVHDEFQGQLSSMTVDRLLEQFVRGKGTGTDIPDVVPFEEYTMQVTNHMSPTSDNLPAVGQSQKALSMSSVAGLSLALKKREKKEKKKKKKKKEKAENGPVDSPSSEGNERTPPAYEVDEEGYTIRPHDTESIKSRGSSFSSDSDSEEDDEPRKIQVHIKPVDKESTSHFSNEDFKKITLNLSSPSSKRKNASSTSLTDFRGRARSGNLAMKLSSSSNDLLDIDFSQSALNNPPAVSGDGSSASSQFDSPKFQVGEPSATSAASDLCSLDPLSPSLDTTGLSLVSLDRGNDTPPALPVKKNSPTHNGEASDSPPPLPAKKRTGSLSETLSSTTSVSNGTPVALPEKPLQGMNDATKTLPFLKPPPSAEIPRSSSVSKAVPRPRPQAGSQRAAGGGLTLNASQTSSTSSSSPSTTSYSAELLSCFSDLNMSTATSDSPVDSEANKKDKMPSVSDTNAEPSTNLFSKAAANHNYSASGSLENVSAYGLPSSKPSGSAGGLQRSVTTTSVVVSEETSTKKLTHSKTVGGLPTMASVMSGTSTLAAAGSAVAKKEDTIPIAVAFIESVNAFFRGSDHSKCMVKVTGDITVSFPASVVPILSESASPPPLTFHIKGTASLEQILPNKSLISSEGQLSGGDAISFRFNMAALAEHLKKQKQQGSAAYYNLDILKYEVRNEGFKSTPLQLISYWKCDEKTTDLRVDYRYNAECMSTSCPMTNMSIIAPVNGGVTIMQSKPSATWSAEHQRALWKMQEISSSLEPQGILRAKFDLSDGPSKPSRIAVQFTCNGATISKLNFELQSSAYKLSLVKKRFTSGKYIAES